MAWQDSTHYERTQAILRKYDPAYGAAKEKERQQETQQRGAPSRRLPAASAVPVCLWLGLALALTLNAGTRCREVVRRQRRFFGSSLATLISMACTTCVIVWKLGILVTKNGSLTLYSSHEPPSMTCHSVTTELPR